MGDSANGNGAAVETKGTCFVISPIGHAGSPERKRANQFLKHIVTPVLEGKYKPLRADQISEPGMITSQVIQHLLEDPLVIADLTDANPNVFYELAIRHAVGKPFVQLITKGQSIPFDVSPQRTIFYDVTDPDDLEGSREELRKQVDAVTSPGFKIETPIGRVLDLQRLGSGSTSEQMLSKLIPRVDGIAQRLERIEYGNVQPGERWDAVRPLSPTLMRATLEKAMVARLRLNSTTDEPTKVRLREHLTLLQERLGLPTPDFEELLRKFGEEPF